MHYLANPETGIGLTEDNITSLFNDGRNQADQLENIALFLAKRNAEVEGGLRDLFIYYVGHGLFTEGDRAYCLALRSTNASSIGSTSMRASDLAHLLKEHAAFLRRFIVLDCCFAGSIFRELQAPPLDSIRAQIIEELPDRGTALLCASSARDVAIAPEAGKFTMFSGALLQVLREGDQRVGPTISFSELGYLIRERLQRNFPGTYVRPQLLLPDERRGDISTIPIFPNPAHRAPDTTNIFPARDSSTGPLSPDTRGPGSHGSQMENLVSAELSQDRGVETVTEESNELKDEHLPPSPREVRPGLLIVCTLIAAVIVIFTFIAMEGDSGTTMKGDSSDPIWWCESGVYKSDDGFKWNLTFKGSDKSTLMGEGPDDCKVKLRRSGQEWRGEFRCADVLKSSDLVARPDERCTTIRLQNLVLKRQLAD
jgi:hypothetical protein